MTALDELDRLISAGEQINSMEEIGQLRTEYDKWIHECIAFIDKVRPTRKLLFEYLGRSSGGIDDAIRSLKELRDSL